jgi:hypothetical protein
MVAFRKLFTVLAMLALLLGATSAFAQQQQLSCNVTAGVPPVVRAEGFTELVGDIVIQCTGGTGVAPFLANFQVFLNTNITSRLVGGGLSEAMLLIDEAGTASRPICLSPAPGSNNAGFGGVAAPGCNTGTTVSGGPQLGTYNAFLGERAQDIVGGSRENSLVWTNVPFLPPGTTAGGAAVVGATRTLRITNLRANATAIGPGGLGLPGQIVAFLSVSPQGTLPLNNPQQIVGYVQPGLVFDVRNAANSDSASIGVDQCVANSSGQRDLFDNPATNTSIPAFNNFRFREGFQTAFKPRVLPGQETSAPGAVFNSESGFIRGPGTPLAPGLADSGTRLAVRFTNVPTNLRIFVSAANAAVAGTTSAPNALVGRARIVSTDLNGAFGATPTAFPATGPLTPPDLTNYIGPKVTTGTGAGDIPAVEVPLVNGTGTAVWEIVNNGFESTLQGVNEELLFPYFLAYRYATGSTQVGLGTGTVVGSFAPFYASAGTMSQVNPIPRFITPTSTPINAVRIQACQTNLLFPYVTNWAGFDTGIAIANTSDDPFSDPQNRRQAGRCRMNYFGKLPNGNAPTTLREETDREVAAGETITFVLSSGGGLGIRGNPNFQGYIIAQCDFRFAHGFAFITDGPIGQARVAEGYLALVLDGADAGRIRGQSTGEVRGH